MAMGQWLPAAEESAWCLPAALGPLFDLGFKLHLPTATGR